MVLLLLVVLFQTKSTITSENNIYFRSYLTKSEASLNEHLLHEDEFGKDYNSLPSHKAPGLGEQNVNAIKSAYNQI